MARGRFKRFFFIVLALLILIVSSLYTWSNWPIVANTDATDPAVIVANEIAKNDIKYSEGYVKSQGNQIHYVSAGEGEAIVFLHGFPSYWFTMFGLMEELKSDYRVVALDGLGVGQSDAPADVDAYKIERLVKHLDDVINKLELGKVHLVGHDWGAAIATGYTQVHPSKVDTLTAIGALPYNIILSRLENDPKHREIFSYISTFKSANPVLIQILGIKDQIWENLYASFLEDGLITKKQADRLRKDLGKPRRTNRFINWYRANFPDVDKIKDHHFWPNGNPRVTVPSLFIYGEDDSVVTPEMVSDFKNLSDAMTVLSLRNTGHRPHFEKKEGVTSAIRELIENIAS